MSAPLQLAHEYRSELNRGNAVHELRLHQIRRDCTDRLSSVNSTEAAELFLVLMNVAWRLGRPDDALEAARKGHGLQPSRPEFLGAMGAALAALDRPQEALPHAFRAVELCAAGGEAMLYWGNLAEVLWRLGKRDEALDALRAADKQADKTRPGDLIFLAGQLAEIGADGDALRVLAKALTLMRGEEVSADSVTGVSSLRTDERLIVRSNFRLYQLLGALDVAPWRKRWLKTIPQIKARAADGALTLLEETRATRARANLEILGTEE